MLQKANVHLRRNAADFARGRTAATLGIAVTKARTGLLALARVVVNPAAWAACHSASRKESGLPGPA